MADYDPQAGQEATPLGYDPRRLAGGQRGESATDPALSWLMSSMPWNRPTYPSGAPPAPAPTPQAPVGAPGQPLPAGPLSGAAQQFMGVQSPPSGGAAPGYAGPKTQDRLGQLGGAAPGVKGNPWQAPGGAQQQPPQGGGAPSGGGAPQHGQVTLRSVWDSLAQANPELLKTREGRITLGMAAQQFTPLMRHDEQLEMQRMKMEMNSQIQMLKLQQGEAKLGLQEERLRAYESRLDNRGGAGAQGKARDETAREANRLAKDLAANPGNKNLQARYDDTMARLKAIDEQANPQSQDKAFGEWITKNPDKIQDAIPDDVKRILSPAEFNQLLERLRGDPAGGHARVQWLRQKARGGESTMEKSGGNY